MKKIIGLIVSIIGCVSTTFAADLKQVYLQALLCDQQFQSAKATYLAATEAYPQARALLLPNIGLTAEGDSNHIELTAPNLPKITENFYSYTYTLSATQPVINFANWFGVHLASYQVKNAAATYAAAAQNLLLRVATAYFNVLEAEDNLLFTEAQKRATEKQLDQATQRFKVGLDAITSVYEARASYDSIVAEEIAAKNAVINNKEQLREITNIYYDDLAKLKRQMPLLTPEPDNIDIWIAKAEQFNFDLQAALFAAEAAREQIKINFSGHLPIVDLRGSYTMNHGIAGGEPGAAAASSLDTRSSVVGLQLNLPIYQGGLVNSQVRQAQHEYDNAIAILENTHRQVLVQLRQTYNSIVDGISKIKADKQAIISQQSSVDSTDAAVKVGTRTIVDLLLAQQQLFEGQKTLSQDQYTYIKDTLAFKQLAGILTVKDIEIINTWLQGPNKSTPQNIYRKKVDEERLLVKPKLCHHHC